MKEGFSCLTSRSSKNSANEMEFKKMTDRSTNDSKNEMEYETVRPVRILRTVKTKWEIE